MSAHPTQCADHPDIQLFALFRKGYGHTRHLHKPTAPDRTAGATNALTICGRPLPLVTCMGAEAHPDDVTPAGVHENAALLPVCVVPSEPAAAAPVAVIDGPEHAILEGYDGHSSKSAPDDVAVERDVLYGAIAQTFQQSWPIVSAGSLYALCDRVSSNPS